MSTRKSERKKKGTFSHARLPVASEYLFPDRRKKLVTICLAGSIGVILYLLVDFFFLQSSVVTSGPLSSYHATFEKDCQACHESFEAVSNKKCSVCHEKSGDRLGIYTLAAHDVYRSGDLSRISSDESKHPCYLCHQEHQGREAEITVVPDSRCTVCHAYDSFNEQHPEFDFIIEQTPDDSTLRFPHVRHVKEVLQREGFTDIERSCLYCHNPKDDGKNFASIEFEQHCSACHLTPKMATKPLKIKQAGALAEPGVETMSAMRLRNLPGTSWTAFMSPSEFTIKPGDRIVKSPIHHKDPWIMENLHLIRREVYRGSGLDGILETAGKVSAASKTADDRLVYDEAIQTLESYVRGLRARPEPEIQNELQQIDSLLALTRRAVTRQQSLHELPAITAKPAAIDERLPDDRRQALTALADKLTQPCQRCHILQDLKIARIKKDQRTLMRAEFNHRAHILHRRCLDCHNEIPLLTAQEEGAKVTPAMDRSAIQNLPGIQSCQECHNVKETSNRCVTCHYFHPNKTNRSNLLLYLEK